MENELNEESLEKEFIAWDLDQGHSTEEIVCAPVSSIKAYRLMFHRQYLEYIKFRKIILSKSSFNQRKRRKYLNGAIKRIYRERT